MNLNRNVIAIFAPGITCGLEGSFKYKLLEELFEAQGYYVLKKNQWRLWFCNYYQNK